MRSSPHPSKLHKSCQEFVSSSPFRRCHSRAMASAMWKSVSIPLVVFVGTCFTTVVSGSGNGVKVAQPDDLQMENDTRHGTTDARLVPLVRKPPTNVPQIFYNIVADGGAVCNGDVETATRSATLSKGSRVLSVSTDTFRSGDVGKAIVIPGGGANGSRLFTSIRSFIDAQHVTLNRNGETNLSAVPTAITYGADDAPAFMKFNTWARTNQDMNNQVVLVVPRGAHCWFGSANKSAIPQVLNGWAAGIKNLIVEGAGARISSTKGFAFQLGGHGVCQSGIAAAGGCSARIQSVSAGAKQVALTSASLASGYITRFPVGKWIMIGGLNPQALWKTAYGYPPNLHFYEWRQITAVDAGSGAITLDRALQNSYLSTWPVYNEGSPFEADAGGPASIWAIGDAWNAAVEYRGLTIDQDGQTYAQVRNITYRGVTFEGGHGGIPTQNETWTAIDTSFANVNMETDKLVGTMTMDGVTIKQIVFQSSSTDLFIMRNSTVTNRLDGGGKRTEITDSKLNNFGPGIWAYGTTNGATICIRCAITTFNFDFSSPFIYNPLPYSMNGGVISFPNTAATGSSPAEQWIIPGGNVFWSAPGYLTIGLFQTQSITQDATNTFVQTNETGSFPTLGNRITFRGIGSAQFTCDACTGDPALVATNIQSGATPLAPLGTFSKRTFTPTSAQGNLGNLFARGKLVSLTINVTQAYTGSGPAVLRPTGQFHLFTIKQSNWTQFDWWPTIDLKTPGERIITPAGVTCNGAPGGCGADTNLAVPEAVWVQDKLVPHMPSAFSGGNIPMFTITIRTDQGVVK